MAEIKKTVDVNVSPQVAYNQWTDFESFPQFMSGVKKVSRMGNNQLHWVVNVDGKTEEWNAIITNETPGREVAWQSTTGQPNSGRVTFEPVGTNQTRVTVDLQWTPNGPLEKAGNWLGMDDRQVEQDLQNFKSMVEKQPAGQSS